MKSRKRNRRKFLAFVIVISILGTASVVAGLYLDDLDDVTISSPVECNILHYDGGNWTNWDIWNETITFYSADNVYYGDGGNLTGISGTGDGYAGATGHPHNQDLNTTNDVTFNSITGDGSSLTNLPFYNMFNQDLNTTNNPYFNHLNAVSFIGDGGNLTNITASGDGYAGATGHPHDQDLNTTSDVTVKSINITGQSSFHVTRTSAQNIGSGTPTQIYFNSEDWDTLDEYSTSIYAFVPQDSGYYILGYQIAFASMTNGVYIESYIFDTSNQYAYQYQHKGNNGDYSITGSELVYCRESVRYYVMVRHGNLGTRALIANYCDFWGYKLGAIR